MPFIFKETTIPEVKIIEPKVFHDDRGYFLEVFKLSDFVKQGIDGGIFQINQSFSKGPVLRGLHYQVDPYAQAKIMRVNKGEVFDVAVDIRRGSPTYGKWVGEILSNENKKSLYIPEGFAHGFCNLSDEAEITYYCSREYVPEAERCIAWNDVVLAINWPIKDPVVSAKDQEGQSLDVVENNFIFKK